MVNPDAPPPPLITTVKPLPINPKQMWEEEKSPDLERNLLEVETSAIEYLTAREEKEQEKGTDRAHADSDSENESIFGEIARKVAEHHVGKKKKKSSSRTKKSDLQFVMHAVANIKAAVRFMLDVKIKSNVVNSTSRHLSELSYEKVFSQKTVTADDMQYFAARTTTESILNNIQSEIDKLPEFEWFQKSTLSEEQLRIMELQQVVLVEQATAIREACNKVLVRRRESTDRETISRLTNEIQRREEVKAIERQYREDQKEAGRERKQAERERKEQEKEAEKERKKAEKERKRDEKEASKAAAAGEKKKRSRHSTAAHTVTNSNQTEEKEENEGGDDNQQPDSGSSMVSERKCEAASEEGVTGQEEILESSHSSSNTPLINNRSSGGITLFNDIIIYS